MNSQIQLKLTSSFPFPPYPSQLELATDIYKSLANQTKVSIFESPTGTGKSQALIEGIMNFLNDDKNGVTLREHKQEIQEVSDLPDWFGEIQSIKPEIGQPNKQNGKPKQPQIQTQKQEMNDENLFNYSSSEENKQILQSKLLRSVPKTTQIIYSSRTHSQLKQWIAEVRKSKHIFNIIQIGSRQQLCCNQQMIQKSNNSINKLNHLCKSQRKNCNFYTSFQKWKEQSNNEFSQEIQDIEDLHKEGIKCSTCPYYVSKFLIEYSDIICMPYQLLLENINNLKNPIIIVDEAHNFGSALLSAQSCDLSSRVIQITLQGLESYRQKYHQKVHAKTLYYLAQIHKVCQNLLQKLQQKQIEYKLLDFMIEIGMGNIEIPKIMKFLNNREMKRRIGGYIDNQQTQSFSNFDILCNFITTLITANQSECILYNEKQLNFKLSFINNASAFQLLIDKCKNMIFVGGTLQPLNEFEEFQKRLPKQEDFIFKVYPHIIEQDRCRLYIIRSEKEYSLKNKQNDFVQLLKQSSDILQQIVAIVPKGIVVFFQSYSMLLQFKQFIESNKIIFRQKLYFDNKQTDIFNDYANNVQNGAILFSVVGGTLSEGINFSDDLARAVVIFGVPFPSLDSIELQKQIKENGNSYYENLTMRSVNQCIGRVIRHKNDYGLLFLVDPRFAEERIKSKLSQWLQDRISIQSAESINFQFMRFA